MNDFPLESEILEAARTLGYPQVPPIGGPAFVMLPQAGGGVQAVELDTSAWRQTPTRKTGTYKPLTVEAFVDHVKVNRIAGKTTIWVHPLTGSVVAIYDDNDEAEPGWRQHRAVLNLEKTEVWKHWAKLDGQMVSQDEFAEHIEVGLDDIAEPEGATVLELAQSFHATTKASFRQATRLHSGETQFQYDEETAATAGKTGEITIPQSFKLAIEPFEGEPRYAVLARFRYRIQSGKLTLGYKLDRPDQVLRDALGKVAEQLTGQFERVYIGDPPVE